MKKVLLPVVAAQAAVSDEGCDCKTCIRKIKKNQYWESWTEEQNDVYHRPDPVYTPASMLEPDPEDAFHTPVSLRPCTDPTLECSEK